MDPVKQKLLDDLKVVVADVVRALKAAETPKPEPFCASVETPGRNDPGLCYFHLN